MKTERPGALVPSQAGGNALATRTDAALARARLLVKLPAPVVAVAIPATCARVGITFLLSGRRDGDKLVVSAASAMPMARGAAPSGRQDAGFFSSIEFPHDWLCPGCRRPHSGASWACDCAALKGALHMCGDDGRVGICACGKSEVLCFAASDGAEVRGSVARPHAALSASGARSVGALPARPPLLLTGNKG